MMNAECEMRNDYGDIRPFRAASRFFTSSRGSVSPFLEGAVALRLTPAEPVPKYCSSGDSGVEAIGVSTLGSAVNLSASMAAPGCSAIVRRRPRDLLFSTSFHPPSSGSSSVSLGMTKTSSLPLFCGVGFIMIESWRGGGGMSPMNQSWFAMRNSSTRWLSWCSFGAISWSGHDNIPGRKMTARSKKDVVSSG
jgi:hypothetical protein